MLKVLRTMAAGVAAGLLLAVTPATAHAQDIGSADDSSALSDVTGLVGAPLNAGILG